MSVETFTVGKLELGFVCALVASFMTQCAVVVGRMKESHVHMLEIAKTRTTVCRCPSVRTTAFGENLRAQRLCVVLPRGRW